MTIEEIIYNRYWENKRARLPKHESKLPPPDEPWSPSEVWGLINTIANDCNKELARRYLEDK